MLSFSRGITIWITARKLRTLYQELHGQETSQEMFLFRFRESCWAVLRKAQGVCIVLRSEPALVKPKQADLLFI